MRYPPLARLGKFWGHLGRAHDLHELLGVDFGLSGFFRTEGADRLEIEQRIGFPGLAGGAL